MRSRSLRLIFGREPRPPKIAKSICAQFVSGSMSAIQASKFSKLPLVMRTLSPGFNSDATSNSRAARSKSFWPTRASPSKT